jgi:hypothetical protein
MIIIIENILNYNTIKMYNKNHSFTGIFKYYKNILNHFLYKKFI